MITKYPSKKQITAWLRKAPNDEPHEYLIRKAYDKGCKDTLRRVRNDT